MKPLLTFAACLMPISVSADWTPPDDPDPSVILQEARDDAEAGRHEDALAKHLWFHEHALKYEPAQYGVRLSFALADWHRLGEDYPPALEALKKARDEAGRKVIKGENLRHSFHDFESINEHLGEEAKTKDAFVALHVKDPKAAAKVFDLAEPVLIEAKEYELCGKYIDPKSIDLTIELWRENQERVNQPDFGRHFREFAEKSFTNEAATLVALLVVNDRKPEAEEVAAKAKAAWDSPDFHAVIDEALAGNVPEPWPSRRGG